MIVWIGMDRCYAKVMKNYEQNLCELYSKEALMYLDLRFLTSNMTLKLAVLSHPTDEVLHCIFKFVKGEEASSKNRLFWTITAVFTVALSHVRMISHSQGGTHFQS